MPSAVAVERSDPSSPVPYKTTFVANARASRRTPSSSRSARAW
jgi:hypothetical protein